MITARLGSDVTLSLVLEDGFEGAYPLAKIYLPGQTTPLVEVPLEHRAEGRYDASWTPADVGTYVVLFIVYADAAHTVENIRYTREEEQVLVTQESVDTLADMLIRVLGLVHENVYIDNATWDPTCGQLTSARVRIFDSKDHAMAATPGGNETAGLIATYQIDAQYQPGGQMRAYRMVKVS